MDTLKRGRGRDQPSDVAPDQQTTEPPQAAQLPAAPPEQVEQQRRVIMGMLEGVRTLMDTGGMMRSLLYSHDRLQMGAPLNEAFVGTGTTSTAYLQAIWALNQIRNMDEQVFVALEKFCR
jgi:hypothetical protein